MSGVDDAAGGGELLELVRSLRSTDVADRVAALTVIADDPTGDAEVRRAVEGLLDDYTPAVVAAPIHIGEVRWLAGWALAAERGAAGNTEPVHLAAVTEPVDVATLETAGQRHAAGLAHLSLAARFAALRDAGLLPSRALTADPAAIFTANPPPTPPIQP